MNTTQKSTEETIKEIQSIVNEFFKDETVTIKKSELWFMIGNPLLGGSTPNAMIQIGREDKLLRMVKDMVAGNMA